MESTLQALGEILLGAIPTFLLVLVLHFYLKSVFFKPLEKVLHERRMATEGARESAKVSLDRAAKKAAEYEEALRAARNEVYREQEEVRRQWREEHSQRIADARKRAEALVNEASTKLGREAAEAKTSLEGQVRQLADQITETILQGAAQ